MTKRIKLILNPIAGGGRALKILPAVVGILERGDCKVDVFKTSKRGDAQGVGADVPAGCQAVVAMGGDGTINEVAHGILESGSDVPLGIIPLGTANVLARELNIPLDPEQACRVIAGGNTRRIDVGRDEHKYFVLMAGVGFDAEVVKILESNRKGAISVLAYAVPILTAFWQYDFPRFSVEVDGKSLGEGAGSVLISNTRRYTPPMMITNRACVDDGELDILIFRETGKLKLLKYTAGALFWMADRFYDVTYVKGKEIVVNPVGNSEVFYQIDGDSGGKLPQKFHVVPSALSVLVP
jgi:YegS/Rv2252/BmrU family lipid kinase